MRPRAVIDPIALGLLTTITVSWALAARSAYGWGLSGRNAARLRIPAAGEGDGELQLHVFEGYGWALIQSTARELTYLPADAQTPEMLPLAPLWARRAVYPWLYGDAPWPAAGSGDGRLVRGTGWPLVSFWHEYRWKPGGKVPPYGEFLAPGGIRIEPSVGTPGAWPFTLPRTLPYRPAWLGLLANTATYAAAFALLARIPAAIRRLQRTPGRCAVCRYDLRGLPEGVSCPECGAARAEQARA